MESVQDILTIAQKQPMLMHEMELLHEVNRSVPGSVDYSIRRYKRQPQWSIDDTGILEYNYRKNEESKNTLELKILHQRKCLLQAKANRVRFLQADRHKKLL